MNIILKFSFMNRLIAGTSNFFNIFPSIGLLIMPDSFQLSCKFLFATRKSFIRGLVIAALSLMYLDSIPQGLNQDFEKIKVGDAKNLFSGLALSPDGKTLAVSSTQSYPLYILDLATKSVTKQYDVGNWYAGSRADYSLNGKYILLNQLYYLDWAPNKDREVNFEVVDAQSGESVKKFEKYHDVKISADERYAFALSGQGLGKWNLQSGDKEGSFVVIEATNSLALSPDGKFLAVSHHTYIEDLKKSPLYVNNKKNRPMLEKYKQQVTVYDAGTFKPLYTIDEFYDIIYRMIYSDDGRYLFIYSIPHTKLQGPSGKKSYVSLVDGVSGEPLRAAFPSLSLYEPDFKLSHNARLLGISSSEKNVPEVQVYDFEKGTMLARFELSSRLFEKTSEGEFPSDGRVSFVFTPDDQEILMTYGNRLILWKLKP